MATINDLISALDTASDYSMETIEQILADNLPSKEEIIAISEATLPYGRTMIKMTDTYEVIIGCWPHNGWCDAHDHGTAIGVVHSYSGEIEHFDYRLVGDTLELYEQCTIRTGDSKRLNPHMIHALQNLSSEEPYIGLHVYVPPTKDVRVFDLRTGDIYHVTDDAMAIIPKDDRWIRSVERNCFSYRNLVKEKETV